VAGKGGRIRDLPLETAAMNTLHEVIGERSIGPLFLNKNGDRLSVRGMRKIVYGHTLRVLGRRMKPHAMRHSFASRLAEQEVNAFIIRDLLGHASVSTTNVYVHLASNELERTIEAQSLIPEATGLQVIQGGLAAG